MSGEQGPRIIRYVVQWRSGGRWALIDFEDEAAALYEHTQSRLAAANVTINNLLPERFEFDADQVAVLSLVEHGGESDRARPASRP